MFFVLTLDRSGTYHNLIPFIESETLSLKQKAARYNEILNIWITTTRLLRIIILGVRVLRV